MLVVFVFLIFLAVAFVNRRLEERTRRISILEHKQLSDMNQKLRETILIKEAELASLSEFLIKKDQAFQELEKKLSGLKKKLADDRSVGEISKVLVTIREQRFNQSDLNAYERNFSSVHSDFFKKLKSDFPDLTNSDLKLASYLKMNLSTKEIAQLLNISSRSLDNKRYFLRKKLKLAPGSNLTEFIIVNY